MTVAALLLVGGCGAFEQPPDLGYRCGDDASPPEANTAAKQKHVGMPCPIPTDRSVDCSGEPDRTPPPKVTLDCEPEP